MSTPETTFELPPARYDRLVDWPRRLAHETPFFRRWFDEAGVGRVLDAACGTGHHAALFRSWGLTVEAADISPAMIEFCRARHGESDSLRWVQRSFTQPASEVFDAVVCLGNSLASVPDYPAFRRAWRALSGALCPGGVLIVHLLNLWRLEEGRVQWQKCVRLPRYDGDPQPPILLKGVHRAGGRGHITFVELADEDGELRREEHRATLLGLRGDEVDALARACGAADVQVFGDHTGGAYRPAESADLIVVARAGATAPAGGPHTSARAAEGPPAVSIRTAALTDVESIAGLSDQLGYPTAAGLVREQLIRIARDPKQTLLVAQAEGAVVGCVHVALRESLIAYAEAEITGLVVDARHQARGIGRRLAEAAMAWARGRGCTAIRVRANVLRTSVPSFYEHLGFHWIKRQNVFSAPL